MYLTSSVSWIVRYVLSEVGLSEVRIFWDTPFLRHGISGWGRPNWQVPLEPPHFGKNALKKCLKTGHLLSVKGPEMVYTAIWNHLRWTMSSYTVLWLRSPTALCATQVSIFYFSRTSVTLCVCWIFLRKRFFVFDIETSHKKSEKPRPKQPQPGRVWILFKVTKNWAGAHQTWKITDSNLTWLLPPIETRPIIETQPYNKKVRVKS